jgi:hypothetical protein
VAYDDVCSIDLLDHIVIVFNSGNFDEMSKLLRKLVRKYYLLYFAVLYHGVKCTKNHLTNMKGIFGQKEHILLVCSLFNTLLDALNGLELEYLGKSGKFRGLAHFEQVLVSKRGVIFFLGA